MKISCVVTGHREGLLAGPSIASYAEAIAEAEGRGLSIERIVVLDRPDDLTRSMFEQARGDWDQIIVTDFGDPGLARNRGVQAASGDYVTFLDADDLWSFNWLTAAHDMSKAAGPRAILHSEMNVVFGAIRQIWLHVDSEDRDFVPGYLTIGNYWDALAFCERAIYLRHPFRGNDLKAGFAHEDWHWNLLTLADDLAHRPVPGTVHYKRRRHGSQSAIADQRSVVPWPLSSSQLEKILRRVPARSPASGPAVQAG